MASPRNRDQSAQGRDDAPVPGVAAAHGGAYDPDTGLYLSRAGRPCFYVASDNLCDPAYTALTPDLVISSAARRGLEFDGASEHGVVFHLLGALPDYGKLGAVCIGPTREAAQALFTDTVAMLRSESSPLRNTSRSRSIKMAVPELSPSLRIPPCASSPFP